MFSMKQARVHGTLPILGFLSEQARLDNRFEGPPSDPLIYGDVVVTHPEGSACLRKAADEDGAAAAGAAADKSAVSSLGLAGGTSHPVLRRDVRALGQGVVGFSAGLS